MNKINIAMNRFYFTVRFRPFSLEEKDFVETRSENTP